MTTTDGAVRPAAAIRAVASARVQEVAIAVGAPARAARASAAPGSTTTPSTSATSRSVIRAIPSSCRCSGSAARTTPADGTPWCTSTSSTRRPYAPAQAVQARITAGVESISVPSMSNSTAANT